MQSTFFLNENNPVTIAPYLHDSNVVAVSGKQHKKAAALGVYTNGTADCVAQMDVNFCRSSGIVPL